jgi:hypothetical protein
LSQPSNIDLAEIPMKFKSGQGAAKAEAQQALPAAKRAYFDALNEVSFKIFVTGPKTEVAKFVALSEEADLICLDAMAFYRQVGERSVGSIGPSRVFGSTQLALLVNDIREWIFDRKQELPLTREPTIESLDIVADDEAAYQVVRTLIRKSAGDVFNTLSLRESLIKIGLDSGYNKPQVPVLFYGFDGEDEISALKQVVEGPSFVVTAKPENSTPEGHVKSLTAIRVELVQLNNNKKK